MVVQFYLVVIYTAEVADSCYACTYSLGSGFGAVVRTSLYDGLSDLEQESVDIHEARHLEVGTIWFWRKSELEIDAYNVQIRAGEIRLDELKLRYKKTGNEDYKVLYERFERFLDNMRFNRMCYREFGFFRTP